MVLHELAFQFTPLREGRHRKKMRKRALHDFNSRPSARGDVRAASRGRGLCISIHAPPRGATGVSASRSSVSLRISIHAPPRGATSRADLSADGILFQFTPLREGRPCGGFRRFRCLYFNSRPSARGDKSSIVPLKHPQISIHAPPRGATLRSFETDFSPSHFNSRPSARGDLRS